MNKIDQKLERKRKKSIDFFGRSNKKYSSYNTKIKKYYKNTRWFLFRIFGSKDGFMHIGLNKNGYYEKNKGYELFQLSIINKIIHNKNSKYILELGCGQGVNLGYLAHRNPDAKFFGIDLYPSKKIMKTKENIHIITGDYHDLSKIPDNSIEIIYAIETLCYAVDIGKVLQEANRVLSKSGILIIFDAYRKKRNSFYSLTELNYLKTIENGFGLKQFLNIKFFNNTIQQVGFSCLKEIDLKQYSYGYLNNISERIDKYLRFGIFLKIILYLFPNEVVGGMKAGYLIKNSIKYNILTYKLHILKK